MSSEIYQKNLELQKQVPSLKQLDKLSEINLMVKKEQERKTISNLVTLKEMYRMDAEDCLSKRTKDNYYNDIYPFVLEKLNIIEQALEALFKFVEDESL